MKGFIFDTEFKIHYVKKPAANRKPLHIETRIITLPMVFYEKETNTLYDAENSIQRLLIKHGYVTLLQWSQGKITNCKIEVVKKLAFLGTTNYELN